MSVPAVRACDLCAVYSAQAAQNGSKGVFTGAAEQFTHFGTLQNDGREVPANGEYIDSSVSQVFAGYNFSQHFGVQFNLPVIYRDFGSASAHGAETGIGDASLAGNFQIYRKNTGNFTFIWSALAGVKFPTGSSDRLGQPDFAPGIGGHDLALGSGSFDGLFGASFSTRWKRIFLAGQMQYALRTEGDFQHRYADDWAWAAGPGVYLALADDYSVALSFTASGETKGKDTFAAVPDADSAETLVYVGPEINWTWTDQLSAHVGVDLPVSIANSGLQVVPDYRIHAAVTWNF